MDSFKNGGILKVRLLTTEGKGSVQEIDWNKPEIADNEIEVKAAMTGICRSDIDMIQGKFPLLPMHMHGHEGLGIVTKVGKSIRQIVNEGDFVATRGEPAYADYYNSKEGQFVIVPEIAPKYILEPVACGLNLIEQDLRAIANRSGNDKKLLILGSGFLAWCAYHNIINSHIHFGSIEVIGSSNIDLWNSYNVLTSEPKHKEYDVIIDIKEDNRVLENNLLAAEGVWVIACVKNTPINTNFENLLWRAVSIILPSPRSNQFYSSMNLARDWIKTEKLNVDNFWTKGYNRESEWQQAFSDATSRNKNYGRGYLVW